MSEYAVGMCVDSCMASAKSFFTNPANRLAQFFKTAEGRDKSLKLAIATLEAIEAASRAAGASDTTVEGLAKGRAMAKTGRDALAFFNIFAGVIAALVEHLKNFYFLAKSMFTGEKVILKKEDLEKRKREISIPADVPEAQGRPAKRHSAERFFAAGSNLGKAGASAAYIGGFGLCRPIANLEKHIRDANGNALIDMGETAHNIGKAFPVVMMVNHICAIFGTFCEFIYLSIAVDRNLQEPEFFVGTKHFSHEVIYKEYAKNMIDNSIGFSEKTMELMHDIMVVTSFAAKPMPELSILLNIFIGLLGCVKEFRKTS